MRASVEFSDLTSLEHVIRQLPNRAEGVINDIIHTEGIDIVVTEMTNLLPISKVNKRHAKNSKWSTSETSNLEFIVKTKGGAANSSPRSYGYLVFPDEGRGENNKIEQNFSGRAAEIAAPKILNKLHGALLNILQ